MLKCSLWHLYNGVPHSAFVVSWHHPILLNFLGTMCFQPRLVMYSLKTWGFMFPPCFLWIFVCLLFFLVLLVSQNRYIIASLLPSSSPLPAFTIIIICECTILAIWRIRLNFPWPSLPPATFVPPLLKSVSEPSSPLSSNPVTIEVSTLFFSACPSSHSSFYKGTMQ